MGIDSEYECVCVSARITLIVNLTQPSLSDTKGHLLVNVLEEATTWLRHDCVQWLKNSIRMEFLLSSSAFFWVGLSLRWAFSTWENHTHVLRTQTLWAQLPTVHRHHSAQDSQFRGGTRRGPVFLLFLVPTLQFSFRELPFLYLSAWHSDGDLCSARVVFIDFPLAKESYRLSPQ